MDLFISRQPAFRLHELLPRKARGVSKGYNKAHANPRTTQNGENNKLGNGCKNRLHGP